MSNNHEFVLLAPEKMNHFRLLGEMYLPIIKYVEYLKHTSDYDIDLKIALNHKRFDDYINLGIPEDYLMDEKELSNGTTKHLFSTYGPGYKGHIENWWKLMYGHGDENFIYNQTMYWRVKSFAGIICYSDYDCYKFSFKKVLSKGKKLYSIGCTKYSDYNDNGLFDRELELLKSRGYDSNKPSILFQHTRDKRENSKYSGFCEYDNKFYNYLRELSESYNIINKSHVYQLSDSDRYNLGFIDIISGEVRSSTLFKIADIGLFDYGGSPIDALFFNNRIYLLDSNELEYNDNNSQNFDILFHKYFGSYNYDNFSIDDYKELSDDQLILRKRLKTLLYGKDSSKDSNKRFVELLDSLHNNTESPYEWKETSTLSDDDYNLVKLLGLEGRPPKKVVKRGENNHE